MLEDLPPTSSSNDRFLLWELIFGRPSLGRSTPLKLLFHRFPLWQLIFHAYSESSYLADQVLAHLSPTLNGNFTDSCSDSSYFIPSLRTHIWQTVCWQIYPPSNCYFTDSFSDSSYFMPTLRVHICQTKYWHIYPPPWMAISQIPALTAHISSLVWELIFGRLCVERSTPHQIAISQIPALTAYISCLLWEFIFGRPGVGRSTPIKWWFHRFLLWQLMFHSHSENSYLAD